jgi:hypothetical protein
VLRRNLTAPIVPIDTALRALGWVLWMSQFGFVFQLLLDDLVSRSPINPITRTGSDADGGLVASCNEISFRPSNCCYSAFGQTPTFVGAKAGLLAEAGTGIPSSRPKELIYARPLRTCAARYRRCGDCLKAWIGCLSGKSAEYVPQRADLAPIGAQRHQHR